MSDDDLLIMLGDIFLGGKDTWDRAIGQLKDKKVLVRGNHDHRSSSWYYDRGFVFVCDTFSLNIFGKHILFTYRPCFDERLNYCDINIHGHVHEKNRCDYEATDKHFLFSMESENYKPLLLKYILEKRVKF